MLASSVDWEASTVHHELRHAEQQQASAILGDVLALICLFYGQWFWATILAAGFGALNYGAATLAALIRGEDPYRGNHLEEAAYDSTHV